MGTEIERKFLVVNGAWRAAGPPALIRQGYLCRDPERIVRVRTTDLRAVLTVKGLSRLVDGALHRAEFEYDIPKEDADRLLDQLCVPPVILKQRYRVPAGNGLVWEIDEFFSPHKGLLLAEIELPDSRTPFPHPEWLGREVSDDPRYANSNIADAVFD